MTHALHASARECASDGAAAGQALDVAYRFLGRWSDGFTRSARDELAHEAAILALDRRHTLRDAG